MAVTTGHYHDGMDESAPGRWAGGWLATSVERAEPWAWDGLDAEDRVHLQGAGSNGCLSARSQAGRKPGRKAAAKGIPGSNEGVRAVGRSVRAARQAGRHGQPSRGGCVWFLVWFGVMRSSQRLKESKESTAG